MPGSACKQAPLPGWLRHGLTALVVACFVCSSIILTLVPLGIQVVMIVLGILAMLVAFAHRGVLATLKGQIHALIGFAPVLAAMAVVFLAVTPFALEPGTHLLSAASLLALAAIQPLAFAAGGMAVCPQTRLTVRARSRLVLAFTLLTLAFIAYEFSYFSLDRLVSEHVNPLAHNLARFNRSTVVLVGLAGFLLCFARARRDWFLMLGSGVALALPFLFSVSQSAQLAAIMVALFALIPLRHQAKALWLVAGSIVVWALVGPLFYHQILDLWRESSLAGFKPGTFLARLDLWARSADFLAWHGLFGGGLDVLKIVGRHPEAVAAVPGIDDVWHSHNGALQIMVDLGLGGVGLLMLALLLVLRLAARLAPAVASGLYGALVVILTVSLVSHGIWQEWWLASFGALALLCGHFSAALKLENTPQEC